MIDHLITHSFTALDDGRPLSTEMLHREGVKLMEELLKLEDCNPRMCDPSTATNAETSEVLIDMVITAATPEEAMKFSLTIARAAIHAAEGSTATWDTAAKNEPELTYRNSQLEAV